MACENCTTFLYVVTELGNTVTSYAVTYLPDGKGLDFEQVYRSTTYGNLPLPAGNAPAEVHVSVSTALRGPDSASAREGTVY